MGDWRMLFGWLSVIGGVGVLWVGFGFDIRKNHPRLVGGRSFYRIWVTECIL
jgi:hypothetical protein